MGLEGIAAVEARISEIRQLFASRAPATTTPAPSASSAAATSVALGNEATGGVDFASLLADARGTSGTGTIAGNRAGAGGHVAQQFLTTALAQKGKPYIYAAHTQPDDPNPAAFDCSELTKWAAARVGVTIPDGATAQYLNIRDNGTTMSVEQALRTPGALLFHFGHEPRDLGDIPADGHVAISVGDGVHTIEARGRKYGTGIFEATGSRAGFFNRAGMIPAMR
jgi:cell wall-associated NlpC family hydrolase